MMYSVNTDYTALYKVEVKAVFQFLISYAKIVLHPLPGLYRLPWGLHMTTENDEFTNLKITYENLISQYLDLLKLAASGKVTWVTRQMIEDHIRVRVREIVKAFTLDEWAHLGADSPTEVSWFRQEAEYLTKLGAQLANLEPFQRWMLSLYWKGLALLFSSAVVQVSGIADRTLDVFFIMDNFWEIVRNVLLSFGFGLLILGSIFTFAVDILTRSKRLRISGQDEYGRRITSTHTAEEVNIYALENELFKLLKRKKPQEPPWDVWGWGLVGTVTSAGIIAGLFQLAPSAPNPLVPWAVGLALISGLIAILGEDIKRRLSRDR